MMSLGWLGDNQALFDRYIKMLQVFVDNLESLGETLLKFQQIPIKLSFFFKKKNHPKNSNYLQEIKFKVYENTWVLQKYLGLIKKIPEELGIGIGPQNKA